VALIGSALVGIFNVSPAAADPSPQTSLTITKYYINGTVENTTTVTYQWLEAHLTVQGDGTTHYYTEGPTFDPNNLWDPTEICPGDSLKDKGALKGTDLKDLCNLVGGAAHGDTVQVMAADGYNDVFDAENIYSPVARQGPIVICWWNNGLYTGAWTDGMLLAFFTTVGRTSDGLLIFGHQDMHDCLPSSNWHWYYDGAIQYPSTNGMYLKWVSQINVYAGGNAGWSISLQGNRNDTVPQTWFENGIACQHMGQNYTDGSGIWSGMPLWYLLGIVDDTTNIHGSSAFNDNLANAGYNVTVISGDGSRTTLNSTSVAHNNNLIVANKLNSAALPVGQYPLKLVGPGLTGGQMIENISSIVLSGFPPFIQASAGIGGSISPSGDMLLSAGVDQPFTIAATAGYHISDVKVDGASVGAVGSYTIHNVTSYHTIAASFLGNTWNITAAAGSGGSISPSGVVAVNSGNNQTFTITANPGYRISDVNVDSSSQGAVSSYTFTSVTAAHNISASFVVTWDLNGDHTCNIGDVVKVGLQWGRTGSAGWIPEDVNPDGVINIGDIVVLGLHWGQTW
jgi:DMSO/TMAO reductase YedYZ molybdopterin-dependent catalytic subunit